ncbi:MAG: protein rep [Cyanobacteriota bacterium]|nr:protein rep [Cyanobacteriota bacterium]
MTILSCLRPFVQNKTLNGVNAAHVHSFNIVNLYFLEGSPEYRRYADRILECSPELTFVINTDVNSPAYGRTTIKNARWCRVRHCPSCQRARASKLKAKFLKVITPDNINGLEFIFLTLTIKNVPDNQIRSSIKLINNAWSKFRKRKDFPAQGFIRSFEITQQYDRLKSDKKGKKSSGLPTRSEDGYLMAHPHLHIVLCMKPGYYEANFKDKDWWIDQWQSCLGVDYRPSVSVKKIDTEDNLVVSLLETLKYTTKPADFDVTNPCAGEWLYALTRELHKVRAISVGGNFSKFVKQSEIDSIQDECKSDDEYEQSGSEFKGVWNDAKQKYEIVSGHIIIETYGSILVNPPSPFHKVVRVPGPFNPYNFLSSYDSVNL